VIARVRGRLTSATRGRRLWVVAFCGFFLMGAAWTFAMPYNGIPDEAQHIVRAAGAGRGEVIPHKATAAQGSGAFQHVKQGLQPGAPQCWQNDSRISAKCGPEPDGNQNLVYAATRAGRYPPAYYVVVGWPLALWPNWFGVILARLIGVALAAALLACAAFAAARWSRAPLMPAAVLVAVTPEVLHLSGGVNPNAVEIAAGLALFVSMCTLLFEKEPIAPRAARTLAGISAATLIAVRPFGPLWIVAVAGVLFVPTTRARLGRVLGNRQGRLWAAALGVVFALSALWTLLMKTGEPGMVYPNDISAGAALRFELFQRLDFYARQMVGVLSWNDAPLPGLCYVAWFCAFGVLAFVALGLGGWADRWRIAALIAGSFAVLVLPDALEVRTYGFVSQGRYVLPLMVGVPVLAAQVIGERGALAGAHARSLTRALAVLLVPIHFIGLYVTMLRWQSTLGAPSGNNPANPPLNVLSGNWLPVLGPELPLGLGLLACAVLIGYGFAVDPAVPPVGSMDPVDPGRGSASGPASGSGSGGASPGGVAVPRQHHPEIEDDAAEPAAREHTSA
jgi:hypothetical protein